MGSLRAGEQASLRALAGKADVAQVVQAISAAEVTLQTAVAVRDRVVGAYQEIIRMQI
jgi:flagellar hook-basal body complex protein FliE